MDSASIDRFATTFSILGESLLHESGFEKYGLWIQPLSIASLRYSLSALGLPVSTLPSPTATPSLPGKALGESHCFMNLFSTIQLILIVTTNIIARFGKVSRGGVGNSIAFFCTVLDFNVNFNAKVSSYLLIL